MALFKPMSIPYKYCIYSDPENPKPFDPTEVKSEQTFSQNIGKVAALVQKLSDLSVFTQALLLEAEFSQLNELLSDRFVLVWSLSHAFTPKFATFVIELFAQESASLSLRESLLPLIVNLTFDYPGFCENFGCESNLLLLGTFIDEALNSPQRTERKTMAMKHALRAIYNLAAFESGIFSIDFLVKYVNWVIRSMKNDVFLKHTTFHMINFFKFGDVDHPTFVELMSSLMVRLARQRNLSAPVCLNICHCIYYAMKRSPSFVDVLSMKPIFEFVIDMLLRDNADITCVCASIMSYAIFRGGFEFHQLVEQEVPLGPVVELIGRNDMSTIQVLSFLENFAALGTNFVGLVLSEPIFDAMDSAFPDATSNTKVAMAQLIIQMVLMGNDGMQRAMTTESCACILQEALELSCLTRQILEVVLALSMRNHFFVHYFDRSVLEELGELEDCRYYVEQILRNGDNA